jgi:hypothetical protein
MELNAEQLAEVQFMVGQL